MSNFMTGIHNGALSLGFASYLAISASATAGCGGRVPGDERDYWLPATADPASEDLNTIYVGMNRKPDFGFLDSSFFSKPNEIPGARTKKECIVMKLILDRLSETAINFSDPTVRIMLSNDIFMFMTDMDAWPNAYYSKDMGAALSLQVLNGDYEPISDCADGPCRYRDVIVIKNRGLDPDSPDVNSLTPAEVAQRDEMAGWMSEELASDFWLDGMGEGSRSDYENKIRTLWAAGSSGEDDDRILVSLWLSGGIPSALSEEGIKNYSLRNSVQSAIAERYPSTSQAQRLEMEIALISYLQLVGKHSNSLIGTPGKCYLDFYKHNDALAGIETGSYEHYRNEFIGRESFSHIVKIDGKRHYFPSFLRNSLDGPFLEEHLDQRFNDGSTNDAIRDNHYLSDYDAFLALVGDLIPVVLQGEK